MTKYLLACLGTLFLFNACQQQNNKTPEQSAVADTAAMKPLPPQEQKLTTIGFALKEGQTFHYKLEQIESLVQDDSISVNSNTVAFYTKSVKSVKEGITTMVLKYDSVRSLQEQKGMGQSKKIAYNSNDSNDRKNKDYLIMTSLLGEEVSVSVDAKGRVQEVGGLSTIISRISSQAPNPLTDEQKSQLSEQLRQVYYAQVIQQEEQSMPDGTLDSTMSWKKSGQQMMPPAFVTSMNMNYKIEKVSLLNNRKVATISGKLNGSIDLADKKYPVTLKQGLISGSGSSIVDVDQGYTIQKHTNIKQELSAMTMNPQTKKNESFRQVKSSILNVVLLKQ